MSKKIIFIGGIHGVGKGTVCKYLAEKYHITHYSSSEILKWSEISDASNKKVKDFDHTQSRLLNGINYHIPENEVSILDGHFCLLSSKGIPTKINEDIFERISPIVIGVLTEDIAIIKQRLDSRDKTEYEESILNKMQKLEILQARKIGRLLNIPYCQITNDALMEIETKIKIHI